MYGVYSRTDSYFQNSPMAAKGKPVAGRTRAARALSQGVAGFRLRRRLCAAGLRRFGPGSHAAAPRQCSFSWRPAASASGTDLALPNGQPFDIEFLDFEGALEPHTAPFIRNLGLLGIEARYRIVDPAQYKRRMDNFDFDIVTENFSLGLTPGEDCAAYFGSETANMPGSRNVVGIADPVVDALIAKALVADTREKLTTICRAIDRVLRAGHYWVPMWNQANHLVAYWDLFDRPAHSAKYDIGAPSTWWFDAGKATRIHLAGALRRICSPISPAAFS